MIFNVSSYAYQVKDDHDHMITLIKPATRIISLAPDITEILFAIGAGNSIVGVVDASDFPDKAKQITRVGSYSGLDLEKIVALKPDLIITWGTSFNHQLARLSVFNIPIYNTEPRVLEDVAKTMRHLGSLTGYQKWAELSANDYLESLTRARKRMAAQKKVTVFYQLGSYSLLTINRHSWINQAIDLCGGVNIFAETESITPEVTWESVVLANPEVIITDGTDANWKKHWQKWNNIQAVKRNHLFGVNPDWIDRAGPRLILGVKQICEAIAQSREAVG